jgi:hypothetical protein
MTHPFEVVEQEAMRDMAALRAEAAKYKKIAADANADADMYANAWQRELAAYNGLIRNKRHHIDAMVLTTRDLVEKLRTAEARVRQLEADRG